MREDETYQAAREELEYLEQLCKFDNVTQEQLQRVKELNGFLYDGEGFA